MPVSIVASWSYHAVKVTRKIKRELQMAGKKLYVRILKLYVDQEIDFIDACNAEHMEKRRLSQVYSCDCDSDGMRVSAELSRAQFACRLIGNR